MPGRISPQDPKAPPTTLEKWEKEAGDAVDGAVEDGKALRSWISTESGQLRDWVSPPDPSDSAQAKQVNETHVQKLADDYRRIRGELPNFRKTILDKMRFSPDAAITHIAGMKDEELRAMSDDDLAFLLGVLDGPNLTFKLGAWYKHVPLDDLAKQVFRVLSAHLEEKNAVPGQVLSPKDQGHVRALLTRMPYEGKHLMSHLSPADQAKFKAWSTRQLPAGDWNATMDYLWAVTGAKPAPGTSIELISDGGMAPDLHGPAAAHRRKLEQTLATMAPHTTEAQAAAAELRELPVGGQMKVIDPKGSLPQMLEAINSAKPGEPVWINAFAFQSDFTGRQIAKALVAAQKRGCFVLAAYDPAGSANSNNAKDNHGKTVSAPTDPAFYELLTKNDPPIPVMPFPTGKGFWYEEKDKDWLSHLKDYVVGSSLFMGGRNLGDEYFGIWQDALFKLHGPGVADGADTFAWAWNYSLTETRRRERLEHPKMTDAEFDAFFNGKYGNPKPIADDFLKKFREAQSKQDGTPTDPYQSPTVILHKGAFQDRNTEEALLAATETATQRYAMESPYASEGEIHAAVAAAKKRMAGMQEIQEAAQQRLSSGAAAVAAKEIPAHPELLPHASLPTVDRPQTAYLYNGHLLLKQDPPVGSKLPAQWRDLGTFTPSPATAATKGGPVQVCFPAYNDVSPEYYAIQSYYQELLDAGVEVYEYTGRPMNHAKLEVADDVVVAGSSNQDARSWRFNNENIFVYNNKALADSTWNRIQDDIRHSIRITPELMADRQKDQTYAQEVSKWLWARKAAKKEI
jgi:phosphatidylserine/phosphatidylglycerophosphate/cardiolipin synthase-like enzyme